MVRDDDGLISWSPITPPISKSLFEELAMQENPIAIHFWASWNRVDQEFDETIRSLQSRFDGWITFYSCDIDNPANHDWIKSLNVVSIPSLLVFVNGEKTKHVVGACNEQDLARAVLNGFDYASTTAPWWKRLISLT